MADVLTSHALALAAALCIALSSLFAAALGGRVNLIRLVRWQMSVTFLLAAGVSLAIGGWKDLTYEQVGLLALSGLFGIALASTTYIATIFAIGPRLNAMLFTLNAPFAMALGALFLGERIEPPEIFGAALVLAGIVLTLSEPRRASVPDAIIRASLAGIVLGVVTAFGQALGGMFARPAMEAGADPFTAMAIRTSVGVIVFLLALALPAGRAGRPMTRQEQALALGTVVFGTFLGMTMVMAALANGNVGIVSTLSSTTPILILPMIWIQSRIAPTPLAWSGAALAVGGVAFIALG